MPEDRHVVSLTWLASWQAYAVRIDGVLRGLVRLHSWEMPFGEQCRVRFE